MSKVKIIDNVFVVTSSLTNEMVTKLSKHAPEALAIYDEDKNEVFKIGVGTRGSISRYGIEFNGTTKAGKICLVVNEKLTKEEIAEKYGSVLVDLKAVEENATNAFTSVSADLAEIASTIEEVNLDEELDMSATINAEEVQ